MLPKNLASLAIVYIMFTFLFSGCLGKQVNSQWDQQKIAIDGNDNDWETYPIEYNEDLDIVYGVANDDDVVSLMLSFQDNRLAQMINARGITIWVDGSGKKRKHLGIRYIDENALDAGLERLGRMGRGSNDGRFVETRQQPVKLSGTFYLVNEDSAELAIEASNAIKVAVDYQNYTYSYEFRIPLREDKNSPVAVNARSKKINVGLEIAGVDEETRQQIKEMMEERRNAMRGRGGGGFGGPPGGGVGFGNRPPRGGGRSGPLGGMRNPDDLLKSLDAKEVWITVRLAEN